jgi:DNA-binding YbaB/EbfC family protein
MFKGLGNLGNIASIMGSLQSLPQKIEELNQRMKNERVTGASPCGRVTVTMNGAGEVQSVQIEEGLQGCDSEQAVMEATNEASSTAKELFASSIRDMTAEMDLNLPGMDGILSSLTGR